MRTTHKRWMDRERQYPRQYCARCGRELYRESMYGRQNGFALCETCLTSRSLAEE